MTEIASGRASSAAVYDALVALHVISAIVGFGAVAMSGVYGGIARTGGPIRG